MNFSISNYIHCAIANKIPKDSSILDMGGTGKFKKYFSNVKNANIRYGIDCTQLPYEKKSFDYTVSVATLEHIGNHIQQNQFLKEAVRVCKYKSFHWFPVNEEFENLTKALGHKHNCIVPQLKKIFELENPISTEAMISIPEQAFALSTLHEKLNCDAMINFVRKNIHINYGVLLTIEKEI